MQIDVNIDDELLAVARSYVSQKMPLKALLIIALETFVRVEKAKRLSAMAGTVSDQQDISHVAAGGPSKRQESTGTYWATVDSRFRITIPVAIREHLRVKPGEQLVFDAYGDGAFRLSVAPKLGRKRVRKL